MGDDGERGQDGYRAGRGLGGEGGAAPMSEPAYSVTGPDGIPVFAGAGGKGAGRNPENGAGSEDPSQSSERGRDGCVVLTYTP